MNNFSDYDISQTHDWESTSLSPHVLLLKIMAFKCLHHLSGNVRNDKIELIVDVFSSVAGKF